MESLSRAAGVPLEKGSMSHSTGVPVGREKDGMMVEWLNS